MCPVPDKIADHEDRCQVNLLGQFNGSPRLTALVKDVFGAEIQEAENVLHELIVEQYLDAAVGAQLDRYGRIVGLQRLEMETDTDYRKALKVKVRVNQSDGGAEDPIYVASEIAGASARYHQEGQANYQINYAVDTGLSAGMAARLLDFLQQVTPAGVSFDVVEGSSAANACRYNSGRYDSDRYGRTIGTWEG